MSAGSDREVADFKTEIYAVGLSTTIGVTATSHQVTAWIQLVSGGTLYLGGFTSMIGTSGFLLNTTLPFELKTKGIFYMSATSATCVVNVLKGLSAHYPLPTQ